MDFAFTPEQEELREATVEFARLHLQVKVAQYFYIAETFLDILKPDGRLIA